MYDKETKNKLSIDIIKRFENNKDTDLSKIVSMKKFNLDSFMRVCSDRPFLYYELAIKMKKTFIKGRYDIVTNVFPKSYPRGLTCEFIKLKTMDNVRRKMLNKSNKEHITSYFYKNSKNFVIKNYNSKLNKKNQNLNLSVDNLKDFNKTHKILEKNSFNTTLSTITALNYLKKKK